MRTFKQFRILVQEDISDLVEFSVLKFLRKFAKDIEQNKNGEPMVDTPEEIISFKNIDDKKIQVQIYDKAKKIVVDVFDVETPTIVRNILEILRNI